MIEKAAIAKLKHRCKSRIRISDREVNPDSELASDMRTYIKMHYDLKEEMMDFFSQQRMEQRSFHTSTN